MQKNYKRKNKILSLFIIIIILIVGTTLYLYFFNIYGVTYSANPKNLTADNHSKIKIEAIPVNAFGKRVPFRYVEASYEFVKGEELVTIIAEDKKTGLLTLEVDNKPGEVILKALSPKSLLSSLIEINIAPIKK